MSSVSIFVEGSAQHNTLNLLDNAGPRSSSRPRRSFIHASSVGELEFRSLDSVANSLNTAASKHRARLLDRCVSSIKVQNIKTSDSSTQESGSLDEHIEDESRELQEDCEFIQRTSIGRLATMSVSLHCDMLNS